MANVQAIVPTAYALMQVAQKQHFSAQEALDLYDQWLEWDKDRALDECIQRFYLADDKRQASITAILAGILFQACDHSKAKDIERAEKILKIVASSKFPCILKSYLQIYCIKRLTAKGNNLLKLLDDCGIDPHIGVTPIATNLKRDE